jgi:hypothetical protein
MNQPPLINQMSAKIDRWFLVQIEEIVDFEEELATMGN